MRISRFFQPFSVAQQLVRQRLTQISQKALALRFNDDQLQPHETKTDLLSFLVPNFFADNASLVFKSLKDNFKSIPSEESKLNSVTNSFMQVIIPIGSNEKLRNQFTKLSTDYIRIGRLLEVLDGLVGLVAYRYCYADVTVSGARNLTIVTLSVDNFSVHTREIQNDKDITINSYVTYVGRSSMEIQTDLYQADIIVASAQFLMVARDIADYKKSIAVPQLSLVDEIPLVRDICLLRYEIGLQTQLTRKRETQTSLLKVPPDAVESKQLHDLFLDGRQGITVNSTRTDKNTLMHKQQRNVHGKAFGGNIMKEIIELGWLCGFKHHQGQTLHVVHIFDVLFHAPVPIGSLLEYRSRVVFVKDTLMIVQIQLRTIHFEPDKRQEVVTTEVHLALESDSIKIREVVPSTYEEGVAYLSGQRLYQKLI